MIWLILPLISLLLTLYLIKIYKKDHDKKKLIFVFSFAAISFSYWYPVLEAFNINTGLIGLRFFDWTSVPIIIAVFIAANDFIFKPKNYDRIVKIFFIITLLSFFIPLIPINTITLSSYLRMIVATEIIFATLFGFFKTKDPSFVLFILAITALSIGGMSFLIDDNNLAIFGNMVGLIFLGLIFYVPLKDDHGISSYFSIKEKLLDTKRALNESEYRYQRIFNSVKDAFLIFNLNGNIVDANKKAFEMYQYNEKEFIGLHGKDIVHPNYAKLFKQFKEDVIKHGEFRAESVDIKKDGTPFNVEVRGTDIEYGGQKHLLAIVRDISYRKKAEGQLRESRRQLSTLLNNLPGMAYQCKNDQSWTMNYVSRGCKQLTEYNPDKLLKNKSISYANLIHPEDKDYVSSEVKKAVSQHKPFELIYRICTASGKQKWVWEQGVGVYDDENKLIDLEGFITDITEWKKADDELKKLASYANDYVNLPLDANLYKDLANKIKSLIGSGIVVVNRIENKDTMLVETIVGISEKKLAFVNKFLGKKIIGNPISNVPNYAKEILTKGSLVEVPGGLNGLFFNRLSNQAAKTIEKMMGINKIYSIGLRHEQELFGNVVIVLTDNVQINKSAIEAIANQAAVVLDKRRAWEKLQNAHNEIREMNQQLEKKVEQRTKQIEQLLKQKDEFINQLGHDLKNPLGPMMNLLPVIDNHITDEKDKEIIQVIQRNVGYMKNLVQKTLELARLNSPNTTLTKTTILLSDLIDQIISQNRYLFSEKQIDISNKIPQKMTVFADKLRLEELINNLLNNAVKYSKNNGKIIISANATDENVTISITDKGIGMTNEQIEHVFDEFYKADESRHDFDSSGLGMAICKRIVEKHGGEIWAESLGLDEGSTFYFSLPKKETQADHSNQHNRKKDDIHKEIDEILQQIQ